MCWKGEFPNFLRSPSFLKSLRPQQTLFYIEKMLQICLCDPLHKVQVAQGLWPVCRQEDFMVTEAAGDCSSCGQYSQSTEGLSIGGAVQSLTKSHLALKMGL